MPSAHVNWRTHQLLLPQRLTQPCASKHQTCPRHSLRDAEPYKSRAADLKHALFSTLPSLVLCREPSLTTSGLYFPGNELLSPVQQRFVWLGCAGSSI